MKQCFGQYSEKDPVCKICVYLSRCKVASDPNRQGLMGLIYTGTECRQYQVDIHHKFHDTTELFEVYECPHCTGHFLVESDALDSLDEMSCPYCLTKFIKQDET